MLKTFNWATFLLGFQFFRQFRHFSEFSAFIRIFDTFRDSMTNSRLVYVNLSIINYYIIPSDSIQLFEFIGILLLSLGCNLVDLCIGYTRYTQVYKWRGDYIHSGWTRGTKKGSSRSLGGFANFATFLCHFCCKLWQQLGISFTADWIADLLENHFEKGHQF